MTDTAFPPTLAKSLVAALAQMTGVTKGRKADAGKYQYAYANLEDVVALSRPILAEHGLTAVQSLEHHAERVAIATTLVHESGEAVTFGPVAFHAGNNAQDAGSAITYYRRYALLSALGLAAEDDDGRAASTPPPKRAPVKKAAPRKAAGGAKPDQISDDQLTMLGTQFSQLGITERNERLEYAADKVGRRLASSKELTKAEASKLIDELVELNGANR